jgi:single-strand DNA-binding protein
MEGNMPNLNRCLFAGHLTADPEVRYIASGDAVCNFSIAVNERFKDMEGNQKERVEYVRVVAWRKLAEIAGEYLSKGKACFIEGKMQTRKWEDKEGNNRYTTEIVADSIQFLGAKVSENNSAPSKTVNSDGDDVPF